MLISAVMPIMSIYRLPHGQYGYSGHVINLPQDVVSFAISLPRLPSELDVLVVRKEGDQSHRDFRVRTAVVERALNWLLQNNTHYRANQIHFNQDALAQLPEDGNLSCLTSVPPDPTSTEQQAQPSKEDPYAAHLSQSFVPNAVRPMTEQETVRQSIQDRQTTSTTLMWLSIGGTPINEFMTEGYFSMAFPTLFPTGTADFLGQRCNRVTIGNYFKHLVMYEDGRFATHPRFRFFALNTEMRWRALQAGRIYIHQHPGDAQLSLDELHDMVGREREVFPNPFSTMQQVYVAPSNTGSDSKVVWCPWLTHSVSQPSSSHTEQLTYSGQNWHSSYAQKILSQGQVVPKQASRILLLLTGSSLTEFRSLEIPSTLVS